MKLTHQQKRHILEDPDCGNMHGIALYCKDAYGVVVVGLWDFLIVIPLQVRQLYFALPWIVAIMSNLNPSQVKVHSTLQDLSYCQK